MVTVWLNCSFISLTPLPLPHYLKRGIFSYMLKRNKENFWPIEAGYLFAASIKGSNEYKQYHHQVHIRSHCHNDIDFEFLNRKPSNVFFSNFIRILFLLISGPQGCLGAFENWTLDPKLVKDRSLHCA